MLKQTFGKLHKYIFLLDQKCFNLIEDLPTHTSIGSGAREI